MVTPTKLVEKLLDFDETVEDLAYDFVENSIGHFYYEQSWPLHRDRYLRELETWLKAKNALEHKDAVVEVLDNLAATGLKWSDFHEQDFPDSSEHV